MSTIKADNIANRTGSFTKETTSVIWGSAEAWVVFDGTTNFAGNCDVLNSHNVSSVTDNGTGNYTVNFTTPMPYADYSALCTVGYSGNISGSNPESYGKVSNFATTSVRVHCRTATGGAADQQRVCVAVFIS